MEKRPADGRPPRSQPAWKIAVVTLGNVVGGAGGVAIAYEPAICETSGSAVLKSFQTLENIAFLELTTKKKVN